MSATIADRRVLHVRFDDAGGVEVQGYLQFTKHELEEMALAVESVASRRPADYVPLYHQRNEDTRGTRKVEEFK